MFDYQAVLASEFKHGLLPVQKNNKVGYINRNGKVVIKFEYDKFTGNRWAAGMSDGRIIARKNGRYHLLDQTGKTISVLDRAITQISDFSQGTALVQQGNQQYRINKQGQKTGADAKPAAMPTPVLTKPAPTTPPVSINTPQSSLSITSQTLPNRTTQNPLTTTTNTPSQALFHPTQRQGKWGFSDQYGVDMIVHVFDEVKPFSEGLAAVRQGDFWGFITPAGDLTIAFRFHKDGFVLKNATPSTPSTPLQFENGKAWIGNLANGNKMCINPQGGDIACQ